MERELGRDRKKLKDGSNGRIREERFQKEEKKKKTIELKYDA